MRTSPHQQQKQAQGIANPARPPWVIEPQESSTTTTPRLLYLRTGHATKVVFPGGTGRRRATWGLRRRAELNCPVKSSAEIGVWGFVAIAWCVQPSKIEDAGPQHERDVENLTDRQPQTKTSFMLKKLCTTRASVPSTHELPSAVCN
jgi:hypothetical protein